MISGAYQPIGLDDEGKVKSQLTPTAYKRQMFQDFSTMYWRYIYQRAQNCVLTWKVIHPPQT